jgi:integrase
MGEIIRKTKAGKFIGWYIRYIDADGRRKQRASKQPSHAEARRMLIEVEARIARGLVGIEERSSDGPTVAELFDRFVAEYRNPKLKNHLGYQRRVRMLLNRVAKVAQHFVKRSLRAVDQEQVAKVREALSRHYPAGTVRTTFIAMSSAMSWAVREKLLTVNPVRGVARPPAPAPQLDFMTTAEVKKLLEEAERRARSASGRLRQAWWSRWVGIAIALHTGMRKGEVLGLRWRDVDLEGQRLTVACSYATTTKSGKPRHLKLPSPLASSLSEWRQIAPESEQVFPVFAGGKWQMAHDTACNHGLVALLRAAGCRVLPRPWHLLRHTFASHFMQSGGSLLALSQILGHADIKTTQIYAHLGRDFLDGEMERVRY